MLLQVRFNRPYFNWTNGYVLDKHARLRGLDNLIILVCSIEMCQWTRVFADANGPGVRWGPQCGPGVCIQRLSFQKLPVSLIDSAWDSSEDEDSGPHSLAPQVWKEALVVISYHKRPQLEFPCSVFGRNRALVTVDGPVGLLRSSRNRLERFRTRCFLSDLFNFVHQNF